MDTLTNVLDCNGGSSMRVKDDASDIVRQAVAKAKQVCGQCESKQILQRSNAAWLRGALSP